MQLFTRVDGNATDKLKYVQSEYKKYPPLQRLVLFEQCVHTFALNFK